MQFKFINLQLVEKNKKIKKSYEWLTPPTATLCSYGQLDN